jgi:hypothetical protein
VLNLTRLRLLNVSSHKAKFSRLPTYHASQAGNLDAANAIISEVYEYLRQWNSAELVCGNI